MPAQKILLGAHMSIAGGIDKAFYSGSSINCTAIQLFTHSNRQWAMKPISDKIIAATNQAQKETGINHVIVHASYLVNLGSATAETVKKSSIALGKELQNCSSLSFPYLVLHPGAGISDKKACMKQISEGINEVFHEVDTSTMILLEIMAGQGTSVGSSFEQLAEIKSGVRNKKRIGFCIDTCHLWAAGYDFSTEKGYHKVWKEFDDILGYENLKAIHINDSKNPLGSHVDRHQEIGQGTIGIEAFRMLMNDPHLHAIPKILETPKDTLPDYAHNMEVLRSLINE